MSVRIENHDLAFSTAWLMNRGNPVAGISEACELLKMERITLGPAIGCPPADRMRKSFFEQRIKPLAVQNLCIPTDSRTDDPFGAGLTSPAKDDAMAALQSTLQTIAVAKTIRANKVILRLGSVIDDRFREVQKQIEKRLDEGGLTDDDREAISDTVAMKAKYIEPYLDRAIRILFDLMKNEPDIIFCIENSYEIDCVVDPDTLALVFEDLKSPKLQYWHHVGHAHAQEQLGLTEEGTWLARFAGKMAGVHLHDAAGFASYLPPGAGKVDFQGLLESLPTDADRVLDLREASTISELQLGIGELRRLGF